jgi:Leu/Phe-tRNA-protein transferase
MVLRYNQSGLLITGSQDNPERLIDAIIDTNYPEEFCLSRDFDPVFIARLMEAGFLVMSVCLDDWPEAQDDGFASEHEYLLMPRHHQIRSILFFSDLRETKTARRNAKRYELRFDTDFDYIVERCILVHGDGWLTPPLVESIRAIRRAGGGPVYPCAFGVYREGRLCAGEFGVKVGAVYTSYSGYYDESGAGTAQLILTGHWLRDHGFLFWDFGMPLDYKYTLGVHDVDVTTFTSLFRAGRSLHPLGLY